MAARKPDHRVLIEQGDGIYASDKRVYEAQGIRGGDIDSTGEVWTAEVLECQNDEKAVAIARELSEEWKSRIKLYRVPFVNTTSRASRELWLDQMKLIVDIPEPTPPIEFLAWMDELNREATRRGYPEWPLPEEIAHGFNCWIERFNKGLTPAEALDANYPTKEPGKLRDGVPIRQLLSEPIWGRLQIEGERPVRIREGVFPSDKEVYEVHSATPHIVSGYGPDGTDPAEFLESVFECENEIEAKQFAAQFGPIGSSP